MPCKSYDAHNAPSDRETEKIKGRKCARQNFFSTRQIDSKLDKRKCVEEKALGTEEVALRRQQQIQLNVPREFIISYYAEWNVCVCYTWRFFWNARFFPLLRRLLPAEGNCGIHSSSVVRVGLSWACTEVHGQETGSGCTILAERKTNLQWIDDETKDLLVFSDAFVHCWLVQYPKARPIAMTTPTNARLN